MDKLVPVFVKVEITDVFIGEVDCSNADSIVRIADVEDSKEVEELTVDSGIADGNRISVDLTGVGGIVDGNEN